MKKKIIIIVIAALSLILSVTGYFLDTSGKKSNVMIDFFEILAATLLLFIIITINFFAISLCIRQIKKWKTSK